MTAAHRSVADGTPKLSRRAAMRGLGRAALGTGGLLVAAALPVALGACVAMPAKAPVALSLQGSDIEEMAQARLPAFQQHFPNLTARYDGSPDYGSKLAVLAAGGSLGDVTEQFTNQAQYQLFAHNGIFVNHDSYVARDKYDLKQFYDLALAPMRADGTLYGLPLKGQIARFFLFYNRDAFASRGIAPPTANWTYDDLAEAATKLQRGQGSDVQMWGYAGNYRELAAMIGTVRPWGGEIISADGKKAVVDSDQVRAALEFHYDLSLKRRVAIYQPTGDPNTLFYQGKAAMLGRVNAGTAGNILDSNKGRFQWNMVRMPKGPAGKRGGMWLPNALSVSKVSKHPDEAWELCKWCCDKEAGVALALQTKESSTPGARPDVYGDARLLNRPGYPAGIGEEQRQAMTEPEPYVTAWNYLGGDLDAALGPALDKVTKGTAAVDEGFLQGLQAQLQAILDKPPKVFTTSGK